MARFFPLNSRSRNPRLLVWLFAGELGLIICVSSSLRAQTPMAPPAKSPPVATSPAPILPPPDTLGRYGKILAPGDDVSYPLKLKMPFPGVGETKIPGQDELNMRDKLEQLALLSDAEIRTQLSQWPAYGRMSLRDEGTMLQRIQDFRDYRTKVALQKAHDMGLLTLTPPQKIRFEKDYWSKRLQMEHDLAKQFAPILAARQQKLDDELFREFSSSSPALVMQIPKPPPANKPAPPPVQKTVTSTAASPPAASAVPPMEPMAQAPR